MCRWSNVKITVRLATIVLICAWLGISAHAQTTTPATEPSTTQPETGPSAAQSPVIDLPSGEQRSADAPQNDIVSHPQAPASEQPAEWGEMAFPFIRTLGGVGLVLSLIVIATMAFRKFAPQYFVKRSVESTLRLIENLSMGEKRSVAVVQVGGQQYLVGNTPHQISLLAVLKDSAQPEDEAGVEPGSATTSSKKTGFLKLYRAEHRKPARKAAGASILPADIRGKMQELRQALER